jgi:hypothetical protein
MPKVTVLDLVQEILVSTKGDLVNSIDDTIEANQIAVAIQDCYERMVAEQELGHQGQLLCLQDATSDDLPVLLKLPDTWSRVEWINYSQP